MHAGKKATCRLRRCVTIVADRIVIRVVGVADLALILPCVTSANEIMASLCFITAGPITKLFAWGEEESGGHVL